MKLNSVNISSREYFFPNKSYKIDNFDEPVVFLTCCVVCVASVVADDADVVVVLTVVTVVLLATCFCCKLVVVSMEIFTAVF